MSSEEVHGDVLESHRHADTDKVVNIQQELTTHEDYASSSDLAEQLESEFRSSKLEDAMPSGYVIDGGSLYYLQTKDPSSPKSPDGSRRLRLGGELRVLCATSTKGGSEQSHVVQFFDRTRKVQKTLVVPFRLLASDAKEVWAMLADEGYDLSLHPQAKAKLADYIMNTKPDEARLAVSHTGWVDDKHFVTPTRVISLSGDEEHFFTGPKFLDGFSVSGSLEGWQEKVALPISEHPQLVFACCCSFAALMLRILKVPGGGFHFFGPSGTGKTTALRLVASVVGSDALVGTWRATANGLEGLSEAYNDLPLPLDEIYQIDPKDLIECIYMIANGRGKHRSNRQGNARVAKAWNVLILSGGEAPIRDICQKIPEGARNRLVDVEFDDRPPPSFCRDLSLKIKDEHGSALVPFVQYCMRQQLSIVDGWRIYRQNFCPQQASGSADRVITRVAAVCYAGKVAFESGILPFDPQKALETVFPKIVSRYHSENLDKEIIEAVRSYVLDNSGNIWSQHNCFYVKEPIVGVGIEGSTRSEDQNDPPDVLEYILFSRPFKKYLCSLGYSVKDVLDVLERVGLLAQGETGRGRQRRVKHPKLGGRTSGYPIKAEVLLCE